MVVVNTCTRACVCALLCRAVLVRLRHALIFSRLNLRWVIYLFILFKCIVIAFAISSLRYGTWEVIKKRGELLLNRCADLAAFGSKYLLVFRSEYILGSDYSSMFSNQIRIHSWFWILFNVQNSKWFSDPDSVTESVPIWGLFHLF